MSERPSWAPNVPVAALGETGVENVRQFKTETSAQVIENPSPTEISDDVDFLFTTADLSEPGTHSQTRELLQETDAVNILFAEGLTSTPEDLMEQANLLIPIHLEIVPREFFTPFIADLFEVMLPMTVQDLGKGEIKAVAGENRIGKLYLDTPNAEESPPLDLTPELKYESPEYILFFHCSGEKQSTDKVERKIDEYQFSKDTPLLWDRRVHPRYIGRPHTKYLITFDADDGNVHWERDEKVAEHTEDGFSIEDSRFIEKKEED